MAITTDGLIKIAEGALRGTVVEDIGLIEGWLMGDLHFEIKEIRGASVLVEFGIRDLKTKKTVGSSSGNRCGAWAFG